VLAVEHADETVDPGASSSSLVLCRCTRHPATTTRLHLPAFFSAIASLISFSDSSLDASRNPQVLMTMASALAASG
jgi:hypothetical protein